MPAGAEDARRDAALFQPTSQAVGNAIMWYLLPLK